MRSWPPLFPLPFGTEVRVFCLLGEAETGEPASSNHSLRQAMEKLFLSLGFLSCFHFPSLQSGRVLKHEKEVVHDSSLLF